MNKNSTPSSDYKNQFDIKSIGMVVLLILLVSIIILWNPVSNNGNSSPSTVQSTNMVPQSSTQTTLVPSEIGEYKEQTNGIVLGGIVLVLIIIGGTVSVIQRKN